MSGGLMGGFGEGVGTGNDLHAGWERRKQAVLEQEEGKHRNRLLDTAATEGERQAREAADARQVSDEQIDMFADMWQIPKDVAVPSAAAPSPALDIGGDTAPVDAAALVGGAAGSETGALPLPTVAAAPQAAAPQAAAPQAAAPPAQPATGPGALAPVTTPPAATVATPAPTAAAATAPVTPAIPIGEAPTAEAAAPTPRTTHEKMVDALAVHVKGMKTRDPATIEMGQKLVGAVASNAFRDALKLPLDQQLAALNEVGKFGGLEFKLNEKGELLDPIAGVDRPIAPREMYNYLTLLAQNITDPAALGSLMQGMYDTTKATEQGERYKEAQIGETEASARSRDAQAGQYEALTRLTEMETRQLEQVGFGQGPVSRLINEGATVPDLVKLAEWYKTEGPEALTALVSSLGVTDEAHEGIKPLLNNAIQDITKIHGLSSVMSAPTGASLALIAMQGELRGEYDATRDTTTGLPFLDYQGQKFAISDAQYDGVINSLATRAAGDADKNARIAAEDAQAAQKRSNLEGTVEGIVPDISNKLKTLQNTAAEWAAKNIPGIGLITGGAKAYDKTLPKVKPAVEDWFGAGWSTSPNGPKDTAPTPPALDLNRQAPAPKESPSAKANERAAAVPLATPVEPTAAPAPAGPAAYVPPPERQQEAVKAIDKVTTALRKSQEGRKESAPAPSRTPPPTTEGVLPLTPPKANIPMSSSSALPPLPNLYQTPAEQVPADYTVRQTSAIPLRKSSDSKGKGKDKGKGNYGNLSADTRAYAESLGRINPSFQRPPHKSTVKPRKQEKR